MTHQHNNYFLNAFNVFHRDRVTENLVAVESHETSKRLLERKEAELNKQLSECRVEIIELQDTNVSDRSK